MFDLGFWELALVALVALVVIGPERLPHVMRTTGMWLGRLRGMTLTVREELEQELYRDNFTPDDSDIASVDEVKQLITDTRSELNSIGREINDVGNQRHDPQIKADSDASLNGK